MNDSPKTASLAREQATRYEVNEAFNRADLYFVDGSHLQFEHTSRSNRWARASAGQSMADWFGQLLQSFRLNAKHLQLFFEDGSDAEFFDDLKGESL